MIVASGAVFVSFLELFDLFAENFLTFLASKDHLSCPFELVVLSFVVALGAVEPFPAAGCSDGDLGVEYMLAHLKKRKFKL